MAEPVRLSESASQALMSLVARDAGLPDCAGLRFFAVDPHGHVVLVPSPGAPRDGVRDDR